MNMRDTSFGVKKCFSGVLSLCVLVFGVLLPENTQAGFLSRVSLSVAEEYNDNIFFSEKKDHDFVTSIRPGLSLLYKPPGHEASIFTANVSSPIKFFVRNSELNNFGENVSLNTRYKYDYSRRLSFQLLDNLRRVGETRDQGPTGRASKSSSTRQPLAVSKAGDLVSSGATLANFFSARTNFRYTADITFTGRCSTAHKAFLDEGGNETSHSIGARGIYRWRNQHNLHAGYSIRIINSRNGDNDVVHNFDIGDDYFSDFKIKLDPTTTLSASTGIGFSTRGGNPRAVNNLNLTLIKIWQTARFSVGIRRRLTGSLGVSGPSQTTSGFGNYNIRLTRLLTGTAGVKYSFFDTDDVDFSTLQAHTGIQYRVNPWISLNLRYSHRFRDAGSGADATNLGTSGMVQSNSVLLFLRTNFNIWPNVKLSKAIDN